MNYVQMNSCGNVCVNSNNYRTLMVYDQHTLSIIVVIEQEGFCLRHNGFGRLGSALPGGSW